MNNPPYGIARQLFRTSYSPNLQITRPSSLNNTNSTHNFHSQIPIMRPDSNSHVFAVRQLAKNNLTHSQAIQQDYKIKLPPPEYYSDPHKPEDIVKKIDAKLEQLNKKIVKNSQDINILKNSAKNVLNPEISFPQEFEKMNKRQQTQHQQCLDKIRLLKEELSRFTSKIVSGQSQYLQKNSMRPDEKQMIKIKNIIEERVKQETSKIKLIIDNETTKMSNQLRWELRGSNTANSPMQSRLKYPFRSTQIVYKQFVQTFKIGNDTKSLSPRQNAQSPRTGKILMSNEKTFYIDRQGFLLDQDNYYLLDKEQKMIRLTSPMLQKLNRQGLLKD